MSCSRKSKGHDHARLVLRLASAVLILGLVLSNRGIGAQDPPIAPTPQKEVPPSPPPQRGTLVESMEGAPEAPARGPEGMVSVIIYLKAQPLLGVANEVRAEFEPLLEGLRRRIQRIYSQVAPEVPEGGWATREDERAAYQTALGVQLQRPQVDEEQTLLRGGGALSAKQRAQARELSAQMEAMMRDMRREMLRRAQPEIELSQAELAQWLESIGATIYSQLRVVNAVTGAVPEERLEALRARPDIAEVVNDRAMTAHLNVSHYAIHQDTWEDYGYAGGIWDPGILDSGVDSAHPRLDHLTWLNRVCLTAAGNPWWDTTSDDVNGHGTHVAGIVVNDDASYWGIAWDTHLALNLKAAYDKDGYDGGGASMYLADMMDCTDWALTIASDDADVFNLSYGGCSSTDDSSGARFWDAVVSNMYTPATISAGNYDPNESCTRYIGSPAIAYNVIAVANIDDKDTYGRGDDSINPGSSWGPTPGGRKKPDLTAPGTDIWSTDNSWEGTHPDWDEKSGTSMAAPHAAGSILLLEQYGITNPLIQKAILISSAEDRGTTGWDKYYGWGYIDLDHAWFHKDDWFIGSLSPSPAYHLYKGPVYAGDTAALVWNRRAAYAGDSYPSTYYSLGDLDLYMYNEADNSSIDYDNNVIDNVHVVRSGGTYYAVIKVDAYSTSFDGGSTESYALATEENFSSAVGPVLTVGASSHWKLVGEEWTANVTVHNTGDLAAHDVRVSLNIPSGLSLVSGANPQDLGRINASSSKIASWTLQADSAGNHSVPVNVGSSSYGETFTGSGSFSVIVTVTPLIPQAYLPLILRDF